MECYYQTIEEDHDEVIAEVADSQVDHHSDEAFLSVEEVEDEVQEVGNTLLYYIIDNEKYLLNY